LLIACANVANLLWQRLSTAKGNCDPYGAGRDLSARIAAVLTESVLLALWEERSAWHGAFWNSSDHGLPGRQAAGAIEVGLDAQVLAFTATVSVVTGILAERCQP